MLMRVIKDQVIKHRELEVEAKLLESLIIWWDDRDDDDDDAGDFL
jgi:hypothetical protein